MRTIYPKFITTLFIILLVAVIVRYTGTQGQASAHQATQPLGYTSSK